MTDIFDVDQSFTLLDSNWSVSEGLTFLQRLSNLLGDLVPSHVIVEIPNEIHRNYLYVFDDVLASLEAAHLQQAGSVGDALDLDAVAPTRMVSLYDVPDLQGATVVRAGERLVGFTDPDFGPQYQGRGVGPPPKERGLTAEMPGWIRVGQTVSVEAALAELTDGDGLPIDLPEGSEIVLTLEARQCFEVVGEPVGTLVVQDEAGPVEFQVKATKKGRGEIRLIATDRGMPIGAIVLRPVVVAAGNRGRARVGKMRASRILAPTSVEFPDLTLYIREDNSKPNETEYTFQVTTADLKLNTKRYGPFGFTEDPQTFFRRFFEGIESLPDEYDDEDLEVELSNRGTWLYEYLFPEELRDEIWALQGSIKSVFIQSEEPWIPWELCQLTGKVDGRVEVGPFFCEAFSMSRWIPGKDCPWQLHLSNVGVVVPKDSGLKGARDEATYFTNDFAADAGRTVTRIEATAQGVRLALESGSYDALHFSGHGAWTETGANDSEIVLEDDRRLTPGALTGKALNLGLATPLVFLNACVSHQAGYALTRIGGWGSAFLNAGAGAFLGTYWSVNDESAKRFSLTLYDNLRNGMALPEAVRRSRLAIRNDGGPTWLAYTLMSHPFARFAVV